MTHGNTLDDDLLNQLYQEDISYEYHTEHPRCPICNSYNIVTKSGMLVDRIECLDCGYEEYL